MLAGQEVPVGGFPMLQYMHRVNANKNENQSLTESFKEKDEELEKEISGSMVAQQHIEPEKPDGFQLF